MAAQSTAGGASLGQQVVGDAHGSGPQGGPWHAPPSSALATPLSRRTSDIGLRSSGLPDGKRTLERMRLAFMALADARLPRNGPGHSSLPMPTHHDPFDAVAGLSAAGSIEEARVALQAMAGQLDPHADAVDRKRWNQW